MHSVKLVSILFSLTALILISRLHECSPINVNSAESKTSNLENKLEDTKAISSAQDHSSSLTKRDVKTTKSSAEDQLDTQETGYLPPPAYHSTDSDYGYDAGKNVYGKQASDWSLYDQGEFSELISHRLLQLATEPLY